MFIQVFMSIKLHFSVGPLWMGSVIIMQSMHMSSKEITRPSLLLSLALAVDKQVYIAAPLHTVIQNSHEGSQNSKGVLFMSLPVFTYCQFTIRISLHACILYVYAYYNGRCYFPSLLTENSPVCHFCPSLWTDKSGQCRLFSIHRISLFLLLFTHKRPSPFFYICPTKNRLLTHKLSILQINQATFDLRGSAVCAKY